MKTKKIGRAITGKSEITKENFQVIKVYQIAREVDVDTKALENVLKNLQREYGFDMETEVFPVEDL